MRTTVKTTLMRIGTIKGTENREQKIRISTYQKLCIVEYTVSDRLKLIEQAYSLFSVPYSFYCAESLSIAVDYRARTTWQARTKRHNSSAPTKHYSPRNKRSRPMGVYLEVIRANTCSLNDIQKLIFPKVLQKLHNGKGFFNSQGKFHNCPEPT